MERSNQFREKRAQLAKAELACGLSATLDQSIHIALRIARPISTDCLARQGAYEVRGYVCRTLTDHLTSCSSSSSKADRAFEGTHIDTRARTLRKQEGGGRCHGWWWWLVVSTGCGCRAEAGVGTQPCWRRRMLLRRGRRVAVFAWVLD